MPRTASLLRRRSAAVLLAASLAALSACGGSDDDGGAAASPTPSSSAAAPSSTESTEDGSAPSSTPAEQGGGTLAVTGTDFEFDLTETELAAGEYEIEFANEGGASHDVRVEQDGEDVAASDVIAPGETTTFSVTLEPGEYVFYCSVGNHRGMGMETTVTVT